MDEQGRSHSVSSVLLRVLVVRAQKIGAHLLTEAAAEGSGIGEQREEEEEVLHALTPFNSRRVRAAASCPSSRPTSARATETPRAVSR
ncbi:hypothetical protein D3C83_17570 [compost metagenome]